MKIKKILTEHYNGKIYNFSVSILHNYIANGVVVHNCHFCYTSAIKNGINYSNLTEKIEKWFGSLDKNQRPFQVAIGGGGEPTLHPEFPLAVEKFRELGIMPNYTTNGMHLTDEVMDATIKHCGGVAVSCHPHLDKVWKNAVKKLTNAGIRTNLHIRSEERRVGKEC